jgi:hypothetical protein
MMKLDLTPRKDKLEIRSDPKDEIRSDPKEI